MLSLFKGAALGLGLVLFVAPAFAEGVELPKQIRPTPAGGYVLRAILSTDQAVNGLRYSLHQVNGGRVEGEVPDVERRPISLNTRAGEKRPVLMMFRHPTSKPEEMALCIYADPPKLSASAGSRLQVAFRYCKLLTLQP